MRAARCVQVASELGRAIAGLVNVLNPDRVVLGGSLAAVLAQAGDELHRAVEAHRFDRSGGPVRLRAAELGDEGSLLGAAELAFAPLLSDPLGALREYRGLAAAGPA